MAAMRVSLDRQRATNENLKRMKVKNYPIFPFFYDVILQIVLYLSFFNFLKKLDE